MREKLKSEIIVNGRTVVTHQCKGRTFIEGNKGTEFAIRLHNSSAIRLLATVSIDGLSVVTGQPMIFDEGGYAIPALGSIDITGWRINNEHLATFLFADAPGAYLNRISIPKPEDIGRIGIMFYREREAPVPEFSLGFGPMLTKDQNVFTPKGRRGVTLAGGLLPEDSRALGFRRENFPVASTTIHYLPKEHLLEYGILSEQSLPPATGSAIPE